jgi:hypothetical protein
MKSVILFVKNVEETKEVLQRIEENTDLRWAKTMERISEWPRYSDNLSYFKLIAINHKNQKGGLGMSKTLRPRQHRLYDGCQKITVSDMTEKAWKLFFKRFNESCKK